LALVLDSLNEPDLVLISFASSSISALLYAQHTQPKKLRGILLMYPSDLNMRVSEPLGACSARQPGEAMSSTL
jgi:hypothetical protein